jgi:hypothetical protein
MRPKRRRVPKRKAGPNPGPKHRRVPKRNSKPRRNPKPRRKHVICYDDRLSINSAEVVEDAAKDYAAEVCGCGGCCRLCVSAEKGCDCNGYCRQCQRESRRRLRIAALREVLRFIFGPDYCDCEGDCPNCYGRN